MTPSRHAVLLHLKNLKSAPPTCSKTAMGIASEIGRSVQWTRIMLEQMKAQGHVSSKVVMIVGKNPFRNRLQTYDITQQGIEALNGGK